jgi:hypothetical protein
MGCIEPDCAAGANAPFNPPLRAATSRKPPSPKYTRTSCKETPTNECHLDSDGGLAKWLKHIVLVLTAKVTRRAVVADGVPGLHSEDGTSLALDSSAADLLGVLPDDLGEVTEGTEGKAGGRVGGAVDAVEAAHLSVVPLVGDSTGGRLNGFVVNISSRAPRSQVLSHCAHRCVVLEDTGVSELLGPAGELVVPLKSGSGVVHAVKVVVLENGGLEVTADVDLAAAGTSVGILGGLGLLDESGGLEEDGRLHVRGVGYGSKELIDALKTVFRSSLMLEERGLRYVVGLVSVIGSCQTALL